MSLPEISRRCLSCGAAVRAGARFCPQCGASVGAPGADGARRVSTEESDEAFARESRSRAESNAPETGDAEASHDWEPPRKEFSAFVQSLGGAQRPKPPAETGDAFVSKETSEALPSSETSADAEVETGTGANVEAGTDAQAGRREEEKRGRVARVRETTRARVETTRARVEKIKDDAIVALEETPDDSGMRFVVVAVAVFVLFLFILLLSTTVLR